jgi:N-acetylneuraminic acid mutarotase
MRIFFTILLLISLKLSGQFNFEKLADFPGTSRDAAFAIYHDGEIYGGFGLAEGFYLLNDWWVYSTVTEKWQELERPPISVRQYPRGFVIDSLLYLYGGYGVTGALGDFYSFSFNTKKWRKLENPPLRNRWAGVAFSINQKGFIGLGFNGSESFQDFWMYNPQTDAWQKKATFPAKGRSKGVGLNVEERGLVGAGLYEDSLGPKSLSDFYWYNSILDSWLFIGDLVPAGGYDYFSSSYGNLLTLGGYTRQNGQDLVFDEVRQIALVGFEEYKSTINDLPFRRGGNLIKVDQSKYYLLWGLDQNLNHLKDFYLFTIQALADQKPFSLWPNPIVNHQFWLESDGKQEIEFYSIKGEKVFEASARDGIQIIDLPNHLHGLFIARLGPEQRKIWVQ